MSVHKNRLAWAAAGIFAVGAVSGWSAPQLLQAAQANDPVTSVASSAVPPAPIGPMTAPNYRAIVAQNPAAVVGVSIEGRMNVSPAQMPDLGQLCGFDPRGPQGNHH